MSLVSKLATSHLENNTNFTNSTILASSQESVNYEKESAYSASPVALTATMISLSAVIVVTFVGAIIYKRKIERRRENIVLAENNEFELQPL